jgi:hypothetical protein
MEPKVIPEGTRYIGVGIHQQGAAKWYPTWHLLLPEGSAGLAMQFSDDEGVVATISPTGELWLRDGVKAEEALVKAFCVMAEGLMCESFRGPEGNSTP